MIRQKVVEELNNSFERTYTLLLQIIVRTDVKGLFSRSELAEQLTNIFENNSAWSHQNVHGIRAARANHELKTSYFLRTQHTEMLNVVCRRQYPECWKSISMPHLS